MINSLLPVPRSTPRIYTNLSPSSPKKSNSANDCWRQGRKLECKKLVATDKEVSLLCRIRSCHPVAPRSGRVPSGPSLHVTRLRIWGTDSFSCQALTVTQLLATAPWTTPGTVCGPIRLPITAVHKSYKVSELLKTHMEVER